MSPRLGVGPIEEGLKALDPLEYHVLRGNEIGEGLPLVDHAQAVHQDLFGAEQGLERAIVEYLLVAEVEGTIRPTQDLENGLEREEILDLAEVGLRDPAARDREARQALTGGLALGVKRVDLGPCQAPAPHQHVAQRLVRTRIDVCRRHHRAPIESQLNAAAVHVGEFEYAGLSLLTDQLEDVGDSEILQVSTQRDGHRQAFLRIDSDITTTTK